LQQPDCLLLRTRDPKYLSEVNDLGYNNLGDPHQPLITQHPPL